MNFKYPIAFVIAAALGAGLQAQQSKAPVQSQPDVPAEVRAKIEARIAVLAKQTPGAPVGQTLAPGLAKSTAPGAALIEIQEVSLSRSKSGAPQMPPGAAAMLMQGNGQLYVYISVSGGNLTSSTRLRSTTVTAAIDNMDRSLLLPAGAAGRGGIAGIVGLGGAASTSLSSLLTNSPVAAAAKPMLRATANLQAPPRDAESIKVLEGVIDIFSPTAADGSLVVLKNITAGAGKIVDDPNLAKNGIEIMAITKETYADIKATMPPGPEPTFVNSVVLSVKDPNGMIAGFAIQDSLGNPLTLNGFSTRGSLPTGTVGEIRFTSPPPADTRMVVYIANPAGISQLPFRFENVPLP